MEPTQYRVSMARREKGFEMGEEQGNQGGGGGGCIGKLIAGCLFMCVVCAVGGYVVYKWTVSAAYNLAGDGVVQAGDFLVKQSDLTTQEQNDVMEPLKLLGEKIKQREVGLEQMGTMADKFLKGPLPTMIMARGFENKYLGSSGLSSDQLADARKVVGRLAHGVSTKQLDQNQVGRIFEPLMEEKEVVENGSRKTTKRFKEQISDEELQACLQRMTSVVDSAGIPDQEFKVDIGNEVRRIIHEGLGISLESGQ